MNKNQKADAFVASAFKNEITHSGINVVNLLSEKDVFSLILRHKFLNIKNVAPAFYISCLIPGLVA